MEVPRQRLEGEAAPTYAAKCDFFTVEIIHGGFFSGSGQNRSYLDGKKICYDYCHVELAYYKMFEALIEDIGYEKEGRIDIYWLPPGCQLNEDGARLLSNDADIDPMYVNINQGHRFHMIYLDHLDSHISGGGAAWDDVVANPRSQLPAVFSPKKKLSNADQSMVSCSVVEESNEIQSNEQVHVRLRPKRQKLEDEPEEYSDSDSDSDYIPEIVDSDYDLEDGDDDLAQEQLHPLQDKKGKKVVEECNSEDDTLDAPDSDEEDMKFNFKSFTPADMHDPKFHAGQLFSSVELLRKAIREYSCKERVNITFPKNDKGRLGAKCEKGCPWYLYASWDNRTNAIMIKTFNGVHNCEKKWQVTAFTARYIAHKYVNKIRACEKMTLKGLAGFVQEDWNMTIKRGKLGRARKIAFDMIYGDEIAQYNMLWDYANELRRSNPGSTFFVELSDEGQFQKCYFSFDACKRGFLSACRPIIFLDGCHLKTQYGGVLLSAVGMDPNDCIYPVAHVVVQSEDTKAWRWFLTALKEDLGIDSTDLWTIMSDKQKGLIKAVRELFKKSPHRFCVRHLWQNFNKNFKGEALKNQLWKCARSTTEGRFRENMNHMLVLNKEAHDWLDELDPYTWVRAYQNEFPKCDVLLNNNCEVFNRYILDAREMPLISMCQRIKGQDMGRNYAKQQETLKWHGTICPKIRKKLDKNVELARTCLAAPAGKGMFVVNDRGVDFSVDTRLEKCSCRRWDLSGIPCCHGVSALRYDKIPPESRVNSCYSIETYCKAYEHVIMPCKDVTEWAKMKGTNITPPPLQKKKGRKAKNRRQQPEEKEGKRGVKITRKGAVIHCGYYGGPGHNINGCLDWKLGLKSKKKGEKHKVRAEPDVSSSDEEEVGLTQEINLQTAGVLQHDPPLYVPEIIATLTQERESRQRNEVEQGPLPENAFIQQQSQSQQPVVQSTATKGGDVHRKREVVAIARLRAAAERREIADQAKFDAAIAKLKEEEEKIKLAAQKKKEELLAKKQAAEDKKKVLLEEKKLAAEQRKKASEEKKRKALEEKLAMADKRREAMEQRKRNAEEAKRLKAEEKQRIAEERKRIATTKYEEAEAMFLLHQSDEMERRKSFLETHEAARQQAWEQQSIQQAAARAKEDLQEKNRREAELASQARDEEERLNACQHMTKACKRTGPSSSQTMRGFKQPRKVNMFDELRGG